MLKIEKTVFISYRRTNVDTARAIYQYLTYRGYDVFFDFMTIKAGDFEQIIFGSIESRAHFVPILTPSALERCSEPNDMVRREIEHALKHKRNIIPLTYEGFNFDDIPRHLPPEIAQPLKRYNGIRVPMDFFDAAMEKLIERLNIPLEMVLHPPPYVVRQEEAHQQQVIIAQPNVTVQQLTAQEYFERGHQHWEMGNWDFAIDDCTEAIRLNPLYAEAYNRRGTAKDEIGDTDGALEDYNQAIHIDPKFDKPYGNRGNAKRREGNFDGAILDYNQSIQINPDNAIAYYNRGLAKSKKGDYEGAKQDYNQAIHINPDIMETYTNQKIITNNKGNINASIPKYEQVDFLRLNDVPYSKHQVDKFNKPINPEAIVYNNRGIVKLNKGDHHSALQHFKKALSIDPNYQLAKNNLERAQKKRGFLSMISWFFTKKDQ